ncbi:MAG: hypothetical protein WCR30_02030 [Clostridia bacterium]
MQLRGLSGETVANGANVLFDSLVLSTGDGITYNRDTGVFTIHNSGIYEVNWVINTNGAGEATSVSFCAEIGATVIDETSSAPITSLRLYGQGLFEVGRSPALLALVNRTGAIVTFGTSAIQASFIIHRL